MSDLIFTDLHPDPNRPAIIVGRGAEPFPARVVACRDAVSDYIEDASLPIARQRSKWMLDEGDGYRPMTRHELIALLVRCINFRDRPPDVSERASTVVEPRLNMNPPADLLAAVLNHPPPTLRDLGRQLDGQNFAELWSGFILGWWSHHETADVAVAKLAVAPGLDNLAPIIGGDEHGGKVGLGRLLTHRVGLPVEIATPDSLTVAPVEALTRERSGARRYRLDPLDPGSG